MKCPTFPRDTLSRQPFHRRSRSRKAELQAPWIPFFSVGLMPDKPGRIPYRCSFCRQRLVPVPLDGPDCLRLVLLVRRFQCPHCFACVFRPFSWIGRLPFPGRMVRRSLDSRSASKSGKLPRPDKHIVGPATRIVARFGRWVQRCESRIGQVFIAIGRAIWTAIRFVPGLLFRNRRRRSTRRFLKSGR